MARLSCAPLGSATAGLALVIAAGLLGGCSNSDATSPDQQTLKSQNQALADPFGYKPDFDNDSVTGGEGYDAKGMQKDLNFVGN